MQGKLDAAGGEGYYAERNQGIAEQITAYGGELGEALAEANRAIGAGRAAVSVEDGTVPALPVAPARYAWGVGRNMETIHISQLGDVYRPGRRSRFSGEALEEIIWSLCAGKGIPAASLPTTVPPLRRGFSVAKISQSITSAENRRKQTWRKIRVLRFPLLLLYK